MNRPYRYPLRGYFVCECPDFRCHEPIQITPDEYDALPPGTFIVSLTCDNPPSAPVVERRKDYTVREGRRYS